MVTGSLADRNCIREAVRYVGGVVSAVTIKKTDPGLTVSARQTVVTGSSLRIAACAVKTLEPAVTAEIVAVREGRNGSGKVAVVDGKSFLPAVRGTPEDRQRRLRLTA